MSEQQWYCPNCGPEISVTVERIYTLSGPDDYIVCTGCGETVDEKAETPAFVTVLQQQIAERDAELSLYRNGYKGACYACESVGELNVSLNIINKGLDEANIIFADRIATLEAALMKIQNPLKALQDEAKTQGYRINGAMAVQLCDSAAHLKQIAGDALRAAGYLITEV